MLCYGCMTEKGEVDVCPHCGYVHQSDEGEHYYLEAGTLLNNRYIIGKVLGHGGFGITYLGLDQNLDLKVAIKEYLPSDIATRSEGQSTVLSFSGDKGDQYSYGLERFLDEAKSLAKYNHHPCIVSTTDFFKSNNTAYLVMEYLDGIPLNEYLNRKGGKLPVKDAIEIMMPMMDALREVHGAGMIHRDISPDNIHITKTGQVKLLDFGAARFALGEKSKSLSVILKPGYAPPEQYASRGKQGPWTDVYAVAATLYRCITNQKLPDAMDRMLNDDVKKPSEMGLAISSKQEAALMKALSIRHEDRYQTIKALQDQLILVEEAEKPPVIKQMHDEPAVNKPSQTQVDQGSKSNRGEADQIDIRGLKKSSDEIVKSLQSRSSDQNAAANPKQKDLNIKRIVGIAAAILVCILIGVAVNNITYTEVPNFRNYAINNVSLMSSSDGVYYNINYVPSSNELMGVITYQSEYGRMKKASNVQIEVGVGDLVGMDYDEALALLRNQFSLEIGGYHYGSTLGITETKQASYDIPNTITDMVYNYDALEIVISTGPDVYELPDLVGRDVDDVMDELDLMEAYGYEYEILPAVSDAFEVGKVLLIGSSADVLLGSLDELQKDQQLFLLACKDGMPSTEYVSESVMEENLGFNVNYINIGEELRMNQDVITRSVLSFNGNHIKENSRINYKTYYNPYAFFKDWVSEDAYNTAVEIFLDYDLLIDYSMTYDFHGRFEDHYVYYNYDTSNMNSEIASEIEDSIYKAKALLDIELYQEEFDYFCFVDKITDQNGNPIDGKWGWTDKDYHILVMDINAYNTYQEQYDLNIEIISYRIP